MWEHYDSSLPIEHYKNLKEKKMINLNKHVNTNDKSKKVVRKVICINTKKVFDSIGQANRFMGSKSISQACRLGYYCGVGEDGEKLKWMYYEDYIAISS